MKSPWSQTQLPKELLTANSLALFCRKGGKKGIYYVNLKVFRALTTGLDYEHMAIDHGPKKQCDGNLRIEAATEHSALFSPLDQDVCCRKIDSGGMLIDIAHLIDHKKVEKYQNRYNSAAKQLKNCELVISGPWPPYHFMPGKLRTVAGNS